ncbi:MAG: phosphatidylinositol-3-phosphatase [Acidimicrobiaceae bacterium]
MKLVVAALVLLAACSSSTHRTSARSAALSPPGSTTTTGLTTTTGSPAVAANVGVMLVVLENREYGDVVGKSPYLDELARRFGSATQAYGTRHPSLPNYLELVAGKTFGITDDCTSCKVEGTTLVDQLRRATVEWQALIESMPSPCFTGASAPNGYAKKHNPFMYFSHVVADRTLCDHVIPLGPSLAAQLPAAPRSFTWVSPNLCHDGHDCSTSTADTWLRQQLEPVLGSTWFTKGGVVIVTYDEGTTGAGCCNGQASGGHIVTVVAASATKPGSILATPVDQAGILGTVEDLFGLPRLADAACPCAGSLGPLIRSGA